MAISDRTRKILWTRSGNKCCICKAALITSKSEAYSATIVGQECHIISEAANGPRHKFDNTNFNYDHEDNLILLCSNCHKIVDTQTNYYSIEKVKEVKDKHEEEIRTSLDKTDPDNSFKKIGQITILPKIKSGKDLLQLIDDTMAFETDYEDTANEKEINFIARIMQTLTDYSDAISFDSEIGYKISLIVPLSNILKEVEENNFALFGEKKKRSVKYSNSETDTWNITSLYLMKMGNKNIVDLSKINTRPNTSS
jgi:hypothetical protein